VHRSAIFVLLATPLATAAALAQDQSSERSAQQQASDLVTAVERDFACDITVHGAPRFDASSNTWLVAFSATGDDCEAAAGELASRGRLLGAAFYRRPNAGEINGLAQRITADVSRGFHCSVTVRGEPRFDEQSAYWTVAYSALGSDCRDAEQALRESGRELQIVFLPIRPSGGLLR